MMIIDMTSISVQPHSSVSSQGLHVFDLYVTVLIKQHYAGNMHEHARTVSDSETHCDQDIKLFRELCAWIQSSHEIYISASDTIV